MYSINLETAQRGVCELLNWSHLVLKVAHGESGPAVAARTLQQIAANISERAKRVESVSPLLDSVATVTSIAGVTGTNLHNAALWLANRVQKAAWRVLIDAQWRSGPDGEYLEKRPEFSDVNDYWPKVREALREIPEFDCDSACNLVRGEADRASAAYSSSANAGPSSSPRPPWYRTLVRLGDQFRDATTRFPSIACRLAHANSLNRDRLPNESPRSTYVAGFSGSYRVEPMRCDDSRDLPFVVAIKSESSSATENRGENTPVLMLLPASRAVEYSTRIDGPKLADGFSSFDQFNVLASHAGRCIQDVPQMLLQNVMKQSLREINDDRRWLWVLFDLAWYDGRSGLSAPRQLVLRKGGGKMSYAYDLKFIRRMAEQHTDTEIPPEWCEKLPEYWESNLDDVCSASATAIDLIIANVDSYFVAAVAELQNLPLRNNPQSPPKGPPPDLIDDALSDQPLKIYRFMRDRKNWTSYDTLAAQEQFWRGEGEKSDRTVRRALKRLQDELNQLEFHVTVALRVEHENRRAKFEKLGP